MKEIDFKDLDRTKNWRVTLYGKPGVGKTTAIKYLKGKTLELAFDDSAKVLAGMNIDGKVLVMDGEQTTNEIVEMLKVAKAEQGNYDNLVLDNISALEKNWFIEQGRKSKNGISNEIQNYNTWTNYFIRMINAFYKLDYNILITAWEFQVPITTESGQTFEQYSPQIRDSVRNIFMGLTDVVGRMIIKPSTGERGVILEGNDGLFAKNRLDNRKGCKIEDLFKWGDVNVQTPSVPTGTGEQGKTETSTGEKIGTYRFTCRFWQVSSNFRDCTSYARTGRSCDVYGAP